ncbi:MAG: tetratricopeptide repeat protein, partial [Bdellovibrionales bacterium]|nr:tetratricopeptide repeat protein [Bdellovibrionales bacterium]
RGGLALNGAPAGSGVANSPTAVPALLAVPPALVPLAALEEDELLASSMTGEAGRLFLDGLSHLRTGQFGDSLAALQEALALGYNQPWYPNVLFWIGVANEGLVDNRSALRAYHELSSRYPKSSRTPLTLLRQGSVLVRLSDSSTARLTFEKLVAQYPQTTEAEIARKRLKDFR